MISIEINNKCLDDTVNFERENLNSIVVQKGFDLQDEKVINASQRMDLLILNWYLSQEKYQKRIESLIA